MEIGAKVLVLLLAKLACCVGLTLAATGALGGLGIWLLDGAGPVAAGGAALIALIAAIVLGRSGRARSRTRPPQRASMAWQSNWNSSADPAWQIDDALKPLELRELLRVLTADADDRAYQ